MFHLILAIDKKRGMGLENKLPWRLKKDMAFFKALTTSYNLKETEEQFGIVRQGPFPPVKVKDSHALNTVIMGRKTWDSIPAKFRPLPERNNLVLSHTSGSSEKGAHFHTNLEQSLLEAEQKSPETFIIGGNQIYTQALKLHNCQRVYLTQIYHEYTCDTFFGELPKHFELEGSSEEFVEEGISFRFLIYENQNTL